jgi:hypothetical protein
LSVILNKENIEHLIFFMNNYLNQNEELLEKAIEAFGKSFNISATISKGIGQKAETVLKIIFPIGEKSLTKEYLLEINKPSETVIGQLFLKKENSVNKPLLITDYVSPQSADKLRELDISFLDSAGNAYFNEPEFYIFITSRSKEKMALSKPNSLFYPSGLRLIFVLLSVPNAENLTYRELASFAGISLGSVNSLMGGLQQEFYLVKKDDEKLFVRKNQLIKRWVQGYAETLRPKLRNTYFQISEPDWQKKIDLEKVNALWGGEVAAQNLTQYLKPGKFTIYTSDFWETVKYMQKQKLRRSYEGEIEVLEKFWNFDDDKTNVPPLLVYADLIATTDARNLETAQIIYDQYLAQFDE